MIMDKDDDDYDGGWDAGAYVAERRYGIGYSAVTPGTLRLAPEARRLGKPPPFARARYSSPADVVVPLPPVSVSSPSSPPPPPPSCSPPPLSPPSSSATGEATELVSPLTSRPPSVDPPDTCPFCDTAFNSPEVAAYTPAELEQLDLLHALGNWAWEEKCRTRLENLSSPWARLYAHRPAFAEAMGACVRAQLHDFLRRLSAGMLAQQARIHSTLTSLKRAIICAGTGHEPALASKAWDAWCARRAWTPDRLALLQDEQAGESAERALELFRDVLRDLGEDEVDTA